MNTETKVFLKKRFKSYYWKHRVKAPAETHRREFGVGTIDDKIKFRHKGFRTDRELTQYLKTEAPYFISYSSAYYEFPENQPMQKKNWLGADLVFDLDRPMEYLSQVELDAVREEAVNLIEFLKADFGFTGSEVKANFSGSKGYHIHVVSEDVKSLSGEARREIVDYITGTGLNLEYFIRSEGGDGGLTYKSGRARRTVGGRVGPKADSRGWAKRIYDVTYWLVSAPQEELTRVDGIGEKTAQALAADSDRNLRFLREGKWDALFNRLRKNIQKQIYMKAVSIKDADKQVTLDTSRLIRLPDTIHGGSGLLAKSVGDLDGFNPLVDAVAFGAEDVEVLVTDDVGVFQMMDCEYGPYKSGEKMMLPECIAVYLMLKDSAEAVA